VKPVHAVVGPNDAGPGERQEMLDRARHLLEQAGVDDIDRFDIPGRGAGEESDGTLRPEVERLIPALQSGSLFGGRRGVMVVDAHQLQAAEVDVVVDLTAAIDGDSVVLVFVADGSIPGRLGRMVKADGEVHPVQKMREKDAAEWLARTARERKVRLDGEATATLLQRFGSDIAALGQALDQLASIEGPITGAEVAARFSNRPDEPMWHYADALAAGDTGEALRRLSDFLTHGHPLALLAFIENDLRRRALAAAAPTVEVFAAWIGARPDYYPVTKAWKLRTAATDVELRRALDAVARADATLKSAPEALHRLTMERLTVALSRWYSPRGR